MENINVKIYPLQYRQRIVVRNLQKFCSLTFFILWLETYMVLVRSQVLRTLRKGEKRGKNPNKKIYVEMQRDNFGNGLTRQGKLDEVIILTHS